MGKVTNSSTSSLVAHPRYFKLLMKGNFNAYLLRPFVEMLSFAIAALSTVRDSTEQIFKVVLTQQATGLK